MISIILGLYVGILGIPFIERVSSPLYDFIVVTQRTTLCNMMAYKTGFLDVFYKGLLSYKTRYFRLKDTACCLPKNPSSHRVSMTELVPFLPRFCPFEKMLGILGKSTKT